MKKLFGLLILLCSVLGVSITVQAAPYLYTFEGYGPGSPNFSGTVADDAGLIDAQGFDDLINVSFTVVLDLDADGFSTLFNGTVINRTDTSTIDFFYADYQSGPLLAGGGVYTGPTNYEEYNYGYQRADTVEFGLIHVGSQDSWLEFYAPLDVSDWSLGTSVRVTLKAYAGDTSSTLVIHGVELTDISAVPIPGAVWLFSSGLIGLVGLRRKVCKSASQ